MLIRILLRICALSFAAFSQIPPIEPGVSEDLAKWRSTQYSNISYKLNLTLEKMSPVLRGSMEIRVTQAAYACAAPNCPPMAIILDWRKIPGHEKDSTISNVTLNGVALSVSPSLTVGLVQPDAANAQARASARAIAGTQYEERDDHLIFRDGAKMGENVIKLDFTSPILTSGSAITRYIDKEDGSEYIYSLFVPSDASTAFPVFDQPDLKARFQLTLWTPVDWHTVSNGRTVKTETTDVWREVGRDSSGVDLVNLWFMISEFAETKPISTYVFAFAAGPFEKVGSAAVPAAVSLASGRREGAGRSLDSQRDAGATTNIYVRKSQAEKFNPHAAEVFRLNREAVKYLETYFDYKFPWPKYDLVLIPEFPFGGMEHVGATFLREDRVIFPAEPTANDYITRANVIFHEAAHQWFGDCVTMRWFDDLWLKEGFAEFMAYKTLEKVMPEYNAWKVFFERNKQAAYATDSTKGNTAIYQPIKNLSSAKSAYGNIVYRKAPSFLRQTEFYLGALPLRFGGMDFYLGEHAFQKAVQQFLKKHEFANATWRDLVQEFEIASGRDLKDWANAWVRRPGMPILKMNRKVDGCVQTVTLTQTDISGNEAFWPMAIRTTNVLGGRRIDHRITFDWTFDQAERLIDWQNICNAFQMPQFTFPNLGDYGYGIFLLDDKSRDYVLKNIQNEKDPFLRSMMWGALWDSVREAELNPREYVELVIKQLGGEVAQARASARAIANRSIPETDETTIQSLLGRVSTALNYYLPAPAAASDDLQRRYEDLLLDRLQNAPTVGLRATYFRAFVNNASTERSRAALKQMLEPVAVRSGNLRTKDKFDIVTRLAILGDPDAPKLLASLEKTETGDDAKRYAYAARAAFPTAENKAKFFNDFLNNKDISESWIESAIVPFNSVRHADLTQQYLNRALAELPNLKRTRKIFFVGNWLAAFISGQRDEKELGIINKFLADNPNLDNDLRLKILENSDLIERAIRIRGKYKN